MDQPPDARQPHRFRHLHRAAHIEAVTVGERVADTPTDQSRDAQDGIRLVGPDCVDQRRQAAHVIRDDLVIRIADTRGDIVFAREGVEEHNFLPTFRRLDGIGRLDQSCAGHKCRHVNSPLRVAWFYFRPTDSRGQKGKGGQFGRTV